MKYLICLIISLLFTSIITKEDEVSTITLENEASPLLLDYSNITFLSLENQTKFINENPRSFIYYSQAKLGIVKEYIEKYLKITAAFKILGYDEYKFAIVEIGNYSLPEAKQSEWKNRPLPKLLFYYKGNSTLFIYKKLHLQQILEFANAINGIEYESSALIEIVKKRTNILVLSTISKDNTKFYEQYIKTYEDLIYFQYVICASKDCIDAYGEDLKVFTKFDQGTASFKDLNKQYKSFNDINKVDIYKFLGDNTFQSGKRLQLHDSEKLYDFNKTGLFYFRDDNNETHKQKDKLFNELHNYFKEQNIYSFVLDIKGDEEFKRISDLFALDDAELPILLYFATLDSEFGSNFYSLRNIDDLNKDKIMKFIDDINNNRIEKDILSENEPPKFYQDFIGAKIITGKSFEKKVINNKKNICVLFYDHTKSEEIKNYIKALGKKYQNIKDHYVDYAIFDTDLNEVRNKSLYVIDYEKTPYLYLFKKPSNEGVKLEYSNKMDTYDIENLVADALGKPKIERPKKKEDKWKEVTATIDL